MSTVRLTAKILDFSEKPQENAELFLQSFRPPYFDPRGHSLQSETEVFHTPDHEIVEEDIILEDGNVEMQWWDDSITTLVDVTTQLSSADGSTATVLSDLNDFLYVGMDRTFLSVYLDILTFAVASGLLKVEYYDGTATAFVDLPGMVDETKFNGNSLVQPGSIRFPKPDGQQLPQQSTRPTLQQSQETR
jgi:hypothetical protein